MASNAAKAAGCHEVLFVREDGDSRFVTESARSNCYAVKNGVVHTSPLGKLILPGVTRGVILELARALGIEVMEAFETPQFFSDADEVFVSAASGILPVDTIDGKPVGRGRARSMRLSAMATKP